MNNNRIVEISKNRYGTDMVIVDYKDSKNVTVEFQDEYKFRKKCYYLSFKNGGVLNPYDHIYYGVGCLGDINANNHKKAYSVWRSMLKRCYKNDKNDARISSYSNCFVSDSWLIFKNFCEWYEENYYEVDNEEMCLDKDILIKNNNIYSADTCLIAPYKINMLFAKCKGNRGKFPIGVSFDKRSGKYRISASDLITNKPNGLFNTPTDAFLAYKKCKEDYIKEVAELYKDKIPKKLYEAMCKYVIEIDD